MPLKRLDIAADRPVLEVLVAHHCFGCERAQHLAEAARTRFPNLTVRVVDLRHAAGPLPRGLVAVPAYVLNGRLLFTGNPTSDRLFAALAGADAAE